MDAALLRALDDEWTADPRVVAAGLLTVLNGLAATRPVSLAIDDLQWLDEPTRLAITYAVRRCDGPRTLLVAGQLKRRRNAPRAAKAFLEEAARLFEEVGAAQWAAVARAELS
jgi:hypothetical protein